MAVIRSRRVRDAALGRRAVLSADRQGPERETHGGRDQVQAGAICDVPADAGGSPVAELSGDWHALQFNAKVPGPAFAINGVEVDFRYRDFFKAEPSTGYETLIYDCMIGDNILFQRADSVEAGWRAVQPFLDA
jgi:hypothetical protein